MMAERNVNQVVIIILTQSVMLQPVKVVKMQMVVLVELTEMVVVVLIMEMVAQDGLLQVVKELYILKMEEVRQELQAG